MRRTPPAFFLVVAAITAVPLGAGLARAQGSRSARETLVQALEFTRAGDCGSADPLLRQVISLQPFNVAARRLLGRCLLDAGRWDEARPQFEALLGLAPDDAGALSGLRAALAAGQKVESARQVEQIESRRTRAEQLTAQYEMRDAEALLTDGAYPAFRISVGVRSANRCMNDFDVLGIKDVIEGDGKFGIPIME